MVTETWDVIMDAGVKGSVAAKLSYRMYRQKTERFATSIPKPVAVAW